MNGMGQKENKAMNTAFLSRGLIEFMLEIARQLRSWDILDRQAVIISQAVINDFTKEYRGRTFYFQVKKDCVGKVFLETALNTHLQGHGIETKEAGRIAVAVIDGFFQQFANLQFYIPAGKVMNKEARAARNKAIIEAYRKEPTTVTIKRLMVEHDIAQSKIYEILREKADPPVEMKKHTNVKRNEAIVTAYDKAPSPVTIKRLAKEYGLTESTVYGILWRKSKDKPLNCTDTGEQ